MLILSYMCLSSFGISDFHKVLFSFGSLSKSGKGQFLLVVCQSPVVLVCSSFVGLLYFSMLLTERDMLLGEGGLTNATSEDVCVVPRHQTGKKWYYQFASLNLKEKDCLFPFVKKMPFFFTHASFLFPVRDVWEFLQI